MLAIGDSLFAYNLRSNESIPEVAADRTGHVAFNAAISGATVLPGGEVTAIPDQRVDGTWAWLVMDGGGNELNGRCGCGDCDAVLDQLVMPDGSSGAIVDIVEDAMAAGTRVVFLGYPEMPEDAEFGFSRCNPVFAEHSARMRAFAEQEPMLWFVDAFEVVRATDDAYFVSDRVHPTPEGSRVMGEHIARAIDTFP